LSVSGLLDTRQTVSLAAGQSQEVLLSLVPLAPGSYPVIFGDVGGFFTVSSPQVGQPTSTNTQWWLWLILAIFVVDIIVWRVFSRKRRTPDS
jgi:hypothetical protein